MLKIRAKHGFHHSGHMWSIKEKELLKDREMRKQIKRKKKGKNMGNLCVPL